MENLVSSNRHPFDNLFHFVRFFSLDQIFCCFLSPCSLLFVSLNYSFVFLAVDDDNTIHLCQTSYWIYTSSPHEAISQDLAASKQQQQHSSNSRKQEDIRIVALSPSVVSHFLFFGNCWPVRIYSVITHAVKKKKIYVFDASENK